MRVEFSSSRAIGLGVALLLGVASTARAQQQDPPRRTTSTRRIPVTKDRPAPPPVATQRVNQDSIARCGTRTAGFHRRRGARAAKTPSPPRSAPDRIRCVAIRSRPLIARTRIPSPPPMRHARTPSPERSRRPDRTRTSRSPAVVTAASTWRVAGGSTMPMGELEDQRQQQLQHGLERHGALRLGLLQLPARAPLRPGDGQPDGQAELHRFGSATRPRRATSRSTPASGGLKLNVPLFRTASRFYLIGGAGAHRITGYATSETGSDSAQTIQNAKTDIGWYGGAGFNFRFGRSALFLESRYINVNAKQPRRLRVPEGELPPDHPRLSVLVERISNALITAPSRTREAAPWCFCLSLALALPQHCHGSSR